MTGRPNPMVGPSLSIAKDGPIPVTSRTTTRQVEPQIKAGGGHQTIRLAKPPIKVVGVQKNTNPKTLTTLNLPPQLVSRLRHCPSIQTYYGIFQR